MRLNEHTHSPDTTGATTSKPKFNPADAGQVYLSHSHQHIMLCLQTGFTNLAYTAAEARLGAGIPQASEMVLETMKKRHMWWPLPDKLLLGLEAAGVANCFHLLCYEISILPSPRLGKYWPFNILLRLGWASLKTVTIKSAHWKIPNVCW